MSQPEPDSQARTSVSPRPAPTPEPGTQPASEPAPESVAGLDLDAELKQYTRWSPGDYAPTVTDSGAVKLIDSAVAPLVAVAAGMRTVTQDSSKAVVPNYQLGSPSSKAVRAFRQACNPEGMVMPWYRLDSLVQAHAQASRTGTRPSVSPSTIQVRPANPRTNDKGRLVKYENIVGQGTPLGVHPSTPGAWMEAPVVMLCEGMLKGASALTGLLLSAGASVADLSLTPQEQAATPATAAGMARDRLSALMSGIETSRRVLIFTIVGVGNWHHNSEWNALDLRGGREFLVAFDGDVATNAAVHRQALQMFRFVEHKGGTPELLNVPVPTGATGAEAKPGVDDFLRYGTFEQLLTGRTTELPPAPPELVELRPGDTRMNEENCVFEEYVVKEDEYGQQRGAWVAKAALVGRISSTVQRRAATDVEMATGRFDERMHDDASGEVDFEVSYKNDAGDRVNTTISGPATILADPPDRWHRHAEAHVPVKVTVHADWPPSPAWLAAAKSHRADERREDSVWSQMGWVPTRQGSPVFIAGQDVIGPHGKTTAAAIPGINDRELPVASRFGLEPLVGPDGEMDREKVAVTIRRVLDTLTAGAWRSDGVAAIVLAAALRPVVPIPPHCVVYFSGGRRSGKALPLSATVPTPQGPVRVGDIAVGDTVLTCGGLPTRVRTVSEVHKARCLDVRLTDGRMLTTSADHLWKVRTPVMAQAGHTELSAAMLAQLGTLDSGVAATVGELAGELGVDEDVLARWVAAASVPSELVTNLRGGAITLHPVGEMLALVSAMRHHEHDSSHPVPFSIVPATTLAVMLTQGPVQTQDGTGGWADVESVEPGDQAWSRCLTVEHYSGMFLAAQEVATHNSWTASQIMSFWQSKPGVFSGSLPGTASDTRYYIENAVAHSPIWVADDVAPTVDRRKAEATEGKIGDIIRAVHNRASIGRMNSNGSSRESLKPRAMFLVTAENAQSAASEMDRVIHVVTGGGFLSSDRSKDACDALADTTLAANHLTAACVQLVASQVNAEGSWADVVRYWEERAAINRAQTRSLMGGEGKAERHAGMAGDLLLGLSVLGALAREVGIGVEIGPVIKRLISGLVTYAKAGFVESGDTAPGASIVRALRATLGSGAAHIAHPSSGVPPYVDDVDADDATRINQVLGWTYPSMEGQGPRGQGKRIGYAVVKDGAWYVLLDPNTAFTESQKAHPELILHGSKQEATWASAWTEGACGGPWKRRPSGAGRPRSVVRAIGRDLVPVPLAVLTGDDETDDET